MLNRLSSTFNLAVKISFKIKYLNFMGNSCGNEHFIISLAFSFFFFFIPGKEESETYGGSPSLIVDTLF